MNNYLRLAVAALAAPALVSCSTTADEDPAYTDPYYGGGAGAGDYVQVTPTGQQGGGYGTQQPYAGYQGTQQPAYQQPSYQQPAYQQHSYQQPVYQQPAYQEPAPTYSGGGGTYTVQQGDTLYRISRNNGTTVEALMSANGLSSTTIHPGDVLRLP